MTSSTDDLTSAYAGRRIALLIDGDNAQAALIDPIVTEVNKFGLVPIRRIYGDWTKSGMRGWKQALLTYAIQPIQQFAYTTGKNATDSALIIDAMDILADGVANGICVVSSDSDYTRLATRAREKGFFVMGIGRSDTPRAFVNSCEAFVYTENLTENLEARPDAPQDAELTTASPGTEAADPVAMLVKAYDMVVREDGWAFLSEIGSAVRQLDPGFDPRTYGHRQLSQLIRAMPKRFGLKEKTSRGGQKLVHMK